MWSTVGRIVMVFGVWGAFLVLAVVAGFKAGPAELAATLGAGTTLIAMGVATHLAELRAQERGAPLVPLEQERKQATV